MPWLILSVLCLLLNATPALSNHRTQASPLIPSIQNQQLVVDSQIKLAMTPSMEKALLHGIAIEYRIQVKLFDMAQWPWNRTLATQQMKVQLSYDPLKQTYILSNLTLSRLNTDRDLSRALTTLGSIQSLPIIPTHKLVANKSYALELEVSLERSSLPNALRLVSLIDSDWRVHFVSQPLHWIYTP